MGRSDTVHLLLVDDDRVLRSSLCEFLEPHGKRVVAVDSAGAAREALSAHDFDVFVFDVCLPDGSGYSLVDPGRGPRTVMISATPGFEESEPPHGARCVAKPFDLIDVNLLVDEISALP